MRRWLPHTGLAAAFLVLVLASLELVLRGLERGGISRFTMPETPGDARPHLMGLASPRQHQTVRLTVFDPDLLWRLNPQATAEVNAEGFRAESLPARRTGRLVIALGDSATLGPLSTAEHWPGFLQDLVRLNRTPAPITVVNAGVIQYSSMQGVQRFRQTVVHRPDVAYFCFGESDIRPVPMPDDVFAARLDVLRRWRGLRLVGPAARATWAVSDLFGRSAGVRVPPALYRRNLEEFVAVARDHGIRPVLVTRPYVRGPAEPDWMARAAEYNEITLDVARRTGADVLDAFRAMSGRPDLVAGSLLLTREGHLRMAQMVLDHLRRIGLVETDVTARYGSSLDLSTADERRLELGTGWSVREAWVDRPGGRWTGEEALVRLERRADERALLVDLSTSHPSGVNAGHLEVNGREVGSLPAANGRHRLVFDLPAQTARRLVVRFVVTSAFVPGKADPTSSDPRTLGVFVHEVRLLDDALAASLVPARLDDTAVEFVSGWWSVETRPGGLAGRWTAASAVALLSRPEGARVVLLDATFSHPDRSTTLILEVDGRTVGRWRRANGRHVLMAELAAGPPRVRVRLAVERPWVPRHAGHRRDDERTLGVFVHAIHVVRRPPRLVAAIDLAEAPDHAPELQHGWGAVAVNGDARGRPAGDGAEAVFLTDGRGGRVYLDLWSPGWTQGRIEIGAEMVREFAVGPGPRSIIVPFPAVCGRVLRVRLITDRVSPPPGSGPAADATRRILVRRIRFQPDDLPSSATLGTLSDGTSPSRDGAGGRTDHRTRGARARARAWPAISCPRSLGCQGSSGAQRTEALDAWLRA